MSPLPLDTWSLWLRRDYTSSSGYSGLSLKAGSRHHPLPEIEILLSASALCRSECSSSTLAGLPLQISSCAADSKLID
jgi:hypothetical protein